MHRLIWPGMLLFSCVMCVVASLAAQAEDTPFARAIKLGEEAARVNDYIREIEIYSAVLQADGLSDPDRRELLRKRAFAHEWAKKFSEAEADWMAALAVEPVEPALYYKRGFFYERRKRYDEALADFATTRALDPKESWASFGEGEVRAARGEHRLAIDAYSEAIRLNPEMMRFILRRASAYNYEQMHAQARADYDKVLADYENKGRATKFLPEREIGLGYLGRGYASNHLDDYKRAKDDFDKVLQIVPNSANALKWRGIALENLGDRAGALADYRAALAISKKDEWLSERVRLLEGR